MFSLDNYFIMEVENRSNFENVDICEDNTHIGYEPRVDLVLKEPGKPSIERLVGTLSGKAAVYPFKKGDLVAVSINFRGYKYAGEFVNHIRINDIKLVKELDYLYL